LVQRQIRSTTRSFAQTFVGITKVVFYASSHLYKSNYAVTVAVRKLPINMHPSNKNILKEMNPYGAKQATTLLTKTQTQIKLIHGE